MSNPIPTSSPPEAPSDPSQQEYVSGHSPSPESSYLRFQKQKPPTASQRKDGALRPSDIAVSSSPQRHPITSATMEPGTAPAIMGGPRPSSPMIGAASPLGGMRSASPRHLSPATSQIFERDVQEPTNAPELSPAIPSHIQTEDHIPAVLEASSLAITDEQLDPDQVEIIQHSQHLPAIAAVPGSTVIDPTHQTALPVHALMPQLPQAASSGDLAVPTHEPEESLSTYGTVDPSDPRRLSFISFADVVHAEHIETGKEPAHFASPSSMASVAGPPRSPSPIRLPLSDRAPASPPTSGVASPRGMETSPVRSGPGSTTSVHALAPGSEITIETMRQTLQKTGSNDIAIQPATPT